MPKTQKIKTLWNVSGNDLDLPGNVRYIEQDDGNSYFRFCDKHGGYNPREIDMDRLRYKVRLTNWSESAITITDTDWNTAYLLESDKAIFCGAVFQLNSNKMYFRLIVNNVIAMDITLSDLTDHYKLMNKHNSGNTSNKSFNASWPLFCYDINSWNLKPDEMTVETNLKIQFKSISGDKKVYRGMTWWRAKDV